MSSRQALLFCATLLLALAGAAQEPPRWILEQAIEASASAVLLPSGASGMLVVTPCSGCPPKSLVTSPRTRFFIADAPVALAALRTGFAARPATSVTVLYDSRTHEVTRVVASAALAAALAPRADRQGAGR